MSKFMSVEQAAAINNQFDDLSAEFSNTTTPLVNTTDQMTGGAGEFSGSIVGATATFAISWREAFKVCSESAGLIAGNTNAEAVDFDAMDTDASRTITI